MKARWMPILIGIAIAVVVGAVTGFVGYGLGNKAGQAQAASVRAGFLRDRGVTANGQGGLPGEALPGQGAGGQTGGAQFNPANFASGQVKEINGDTMQLSTATEVLTVKISDQTQIRKMGEGSLSDIQPGERVTLQGTRGSDGTFAALMIQIGGGPGGGGPPAPAATPGN
jgi:hypothetical protein